MTETMTRQQKTIYEAICKVEDKLSMIQERRECLMDDDDDYGEYDEEDMDELAELDGMQDEIEAEKKKLTSYYRSMWGDLPKA